MYTYSFEKLEVWQLSRNTVKDIYKITEQFPDKERFGLTSQIRRAIVSVSSNLAEGSSRKTSREQARFTQIAFSSLLEVLNQLILSTDLNYISTEELNEIRPKIEELSNKLNAFYNSQINR
jgi:four helix bundle protein